MTKKTVEKTRLLQTIIPPAFLAALAGFIYYPSLHYAFQFDDVPNILKHFNLRHYTFFDLFFSGSRWIVSWINSIHYKIGKFDPFSYRLFNITLHMLNGLLIFFILATVLKQLKTKSFFSVHALEVAFATSLLFLIHPVQTQTVSYVIQGQLEGLAFFFILLIIFLFTRATLTSSTIKKNAFFTLIFCLIPFSCSTKEIAIISPLLLFIIDWFFIAHGNLLELKKRIWFYALYTASVITMYLYYLKPAFFLNILGFKIVAHNNIGNVLTQHAQDPITPGLFLISQFKVIVHYLWIFMWPFDMSVEYDWKLCTGFFSYDCIMPFLLVCAIAFLTIHLLRKSIIHPLAFGFVWFFACITPRSSIIPSSELLVDYKTYMASLGVLFLIASLMVAGLYYLKQKFSRLSYAAACTIVVSLSWCTLQRNTVWRSPVEFWGDVIKHAPQKARAYNNYGVELSQTQQKYKESLPYFLKAIELDSRYPDAYNNVAVVHSLLGDPDKGIQVLQNCLRLNPTYPEAYNNLASFFIKKREYDKAESLLQTALKLRPHYGKAYYNLCRIYAEKGDTQTAWNYLKDSCTKADFDNDFGFYTFGNFSFTLKKFEDAIWGFNKTLELNPNYPGAEFNLANCYFYLQKFDKALSHYQNAIKQNPQDPRPLYNLAETYFVLHQTPQALKTFNQLLSLQDKFPNLMVRIAACHEKMGNPRQAYALLQNHERSVPESYKPELNKLIRAMKKQYSFA